jgi:hypothetical protein
MPLKLFQQVKEFRRYLEDIQGNISNYTKWFSNEIYRKIEDVMQEISHYLRIFSRYKRSLSFEGSDIVELCKWQGEKAKGQWDRTDF